MAEMVAVLCLVGFGVFLAVFSVALDGWVLSILWGWFMVPIFHLPALGVCQAIGVTLVVRFLTKNIGVKNESGSKGATIEVSTAILAPFLFLFFGWIVQLFM